MFRTCSGAGAIALYAAAVCAVSAAAQDAGTDPRLAESRAAFDEATKLRDEGKYAEALAAAERALALRKAVLGETDLQVADCMFLAGGTARQAGQYTRAEQFLSSALSIREKALGGNHPDVAASLHGLAGLYFEQGLYDRAEPLYQRSLAIREKALGENHPDVAWSLSNLGAVYYETGRYSLAEPLQQRALAIREKVLGKNHPDVAWSLDNLANLYADEGLYGRAEPLYQRAITILEAALGKNHPEIGKPLNNLAILYLEQGLYDRAEPLHQRALAIREAALGKDHPDVALSLNNLASLYAEQGLFDRAEPLYQRALAILEKAFGPNHRDVAMALNNLAAVYSGKGQFEQAESLHRRALAIREAALGKDHRDVARSLLNLANAQFALGRYDQAEPLYQRALAIREAALGKDHPLVGKSLGGLAQARLAQHHLADALPLFERAFAISEARLRQEALDFSESRLASFLAGVSADEERLYALLRAHPEDAGVRRLALAAALLLKGRSTQEIANTSRIIYRSLGAEDRQSFERLRGLRTQLAMLSLGGPGALDPAAYQQRLKDLAEQGDAIEGELGKRSAPLRALAALPSPAEIVGRVAASLPPDAALVEFVGYVDRPLVPRPGTPPSKIPSQLRSLALVLFPDGSNQAVDLGAAEPIEAATASLHRALAGQDAAVQGAARKLHQLAFKPVLPLLGKVRKLYLSPDGQLSLVPFAALHDGRHFLADTFDFTYLTSGRDLLPRPGGDVPGPATVAVFADPDYDAAPPVLAERADPVERSFPLDEDRAGLSGQRWGSLPSTREEAQAIHQLLPQAQLFLGPAASKEQLLQLPTPGILHIATHGFFLADTPEAPGGRGVGAVGKSRPLPRPRDPLLRSGLVLAGATADLGHSLVTALELSGLDLWGTELVVLSACDTGQGDARRGQGVYGLRRALVVAGAETVVVSLWKVNDETTRVMMEGYYRNLLAGQGRAQALRQAMLSLRAEHPHPYFWAPFIVVGRDAPLRGFGPHPAE